MFTKLQIIIVLVVVHQKRENLDPETHIKPTSGSDPVCYKCAYSCQTQVSKSGSSVTHSKFLE